jgi:hypothetical protein
MRAYEEVADFIATRSPRDVADFKPSSEARSRAIELLLKLRYELLFIPRMRKDQSLLAIVERCQSHWRVRK